MNNKPTSNLLEEVNELDSVISELGIVKIQYLPSPRDMKNGNLRSLTKHATSMLRNYQRHINGDTTAPVREIFAN